MFQNPSFPVNSIYSFIFLRAFYEIFTKFSFIKRRQEHCVNDFKNSTLTRLTDSSLKTRRSFLTTPANPLILIHLGIRNPFDCIIPQISFQWNSWATFLEINFGNLITSKQMTIEHLKKKIKKAAFYWHSTYKKPRNLIPIPSKKLLRTRVSNCFRL